jgi:cellulose synthase operon protein C
MMPRWILPVILSGSFAGSLTGALAAQSFVKPGVLDNCRALRHHGKVKEAQVCFAGLASSTDSFLRAEGNWGLDRYDEANNQFRLAFKEHPNSAEVRTEWGLLFLERFNRAEAGNLFKEALTLDDNYAPAYLGLARIAAEGYDEGAVKYAKLALARQPKYFEANELLAYLALEDNDPKEAAAQAQAALAISSEALDAMAVLASIDWLDEKPDSQWMARILKVNPVYGEAYSTGAHFLVINRRYDAGIALYRKALDLNPRLWDARSELGMNLMRTGHNEEAVKQLRQSYEAGYRNAETVNSLALLDSLKDYQSFSTATTLLIVHKKEAALLKPYLEPELARAIATYQQKYKYTLPGPVRLEAYPNHEDFIVRTLGLPGQGGLLGVTFGQVVAMDSPTAREPGAFNWGATLWHELSHVYVLSMTHHLVPRWFTEGLAVHEETAVEPDWGDRLTPDILAVLGDTSGKKHLLPVLELDRGFVRPEYPSQVIVSYYQAGKICDFIVQKWGNDAILGMIHSYAERKDTAEAIRDNLHESPQAFDTEFKSWLNLKTDGVIQHFPDWKKRLVEAHAKMQAGKTGDAIREGLAIRGLYPDYVEGGSVYELLADAYSAQGDKAAAMAEWEQYSDRGGRNVTALKKLATIQESAGQPRKAAVTLGRINYIYPEDAEVHRKLGSLELEAGNVKESIREFQAVVALKPSDVAESHFDLAKALERAGKKAEARDEVLQALEAAPSFKPAQRLLLELSQ